MRRLAIVFAILAAVSTIENVVLPASFTRFCEAPRRIHRALIGMADWRAWLIGPLRLLQRTVSPGGGPWLGQGN